MIELSPKTVKFISEHRNDDIRVLALKAKNYPDIDINEAVKQISGRQIAEKKIPSWAEQENIIYPKHLSMEQCSSEITARYKASLVSGETFADLTAGFGVDFYFISRQFNHAYYVERQEELCEIAKHNFKVLGANHIEFCNTDGVDFLDHMNTVDCIFIDPARRNSNGGKTVAISDCEPDICKLERKLVEKGRTVLIKLSPMLDIHNALKELTHISDIHIVSVNNECKELVIRMTKHSEPENNIADKAEICCKQFVNNATPQEFRFTYSEEKNTEIRYTDTIGKYLYEPGAAILKASPFKLLSARYGVDKLHPNSHLYTSNEVVDFPGRRFKVIEVSTFGKKELKAFLKDLEKANITIRNFPCSVDELRKKLKLKDGGDTYIFATTLNNGNKVLIKCRSVKSFIP